MILQIKDANGNWVGIPAIQGTPGEGGGVERRILTIGGNPLLSDEDKAFVEDYFKYYLENGEYKPVELCIFTTGGMSYGKPYNNFYLVTNVDVHWQASYWVMHLTYNVTHDMKHYLYFNINAEGKITSYNSNSEFVMIPEGSGDWNTTTDNSADGLYNATEVYIRLQNINNNLYGFSYLIVPNGDTLGNYCYQDVVITTTDGLDNMVAHWYYTGSSIIINFSDSEYYVDYIAYK